MLRFRMLRLRKSAVQAYLYGLVSCAENADSICVVAIGATFYSAWLRLRIFLFGEKEI